jgi:hypothetical protein
MNIEIWVEHHQAPILAVTLLLALLGASKQIRTILSALSALPKGLKAVRAAYRSITLAMLEEHQQDPNTLWRQIVVTCATNTFLFCLSGLIYGVYLGHLPTKEMDPVVVAYFRLTISMFIIRVELWAILMAAIYSAGFTLALLWLYRRPSSRIDCLRRLLKGDPESSDITKSNEITKAS